MAVKTAVLIALGFCASATKLSGEECSDGRCVSDEVSLLQERTQLHTKEGRAAIAAGSDPFGTESCPCIGIDDVKGVLFVGHDTYPPDLGAHCKAWDKAADCKEDWCNEKWCYVDPCNCEGTAELPKPSDYLADAKYQGHSIYYSYTTCGGADKYTKADSDSAREDRIKESCDKKIDDKEWGKDGCRCQGFTPEHGKVQVKNGKKTLEYQADYGANCKAWDADNDPKCMSGNPPSYCSEKWCYVADDCKADNVTSETSKIMPDATADGKPVKYSYDTCGGQDKYTNGDESAETGTASRYGTSTCECIGIDHADGSVTGEVDGKKVSFPADYGAHCATWDSTGNPDCNSSDAADWCQQKWCYVDPCTCKGTEEMPKPSDYLKGAEYQGVGLFYSYSTCGAKDSYSADDSEANREQKIQGACGGDVDNKVWGSKDCLCTGIAPLDGDVKVKTGDKYEADYGANCEEWDNGNDPKCKGDTPPDYCAEKWCYVNPDDCKGVSPKPKPSAMLPDATSDAGKPLYFSYATCGGTDKFSGYSAGSKAFDQEKSQASQFSAGILVLAAVFFGRP